MVLINKEAYIVQVMDGSHLAMGYSYSFKEMTQMASPNGDAFVYMLGNEVDWISKEEPVGKPVITGYDRNGDLQVFINGDGNTIFLGSVFTFGFLRNRETGGMVEYESTTWEHFDQVLKGEHVNFMGHQSTASLVNMEMQRISIRVSPGDTVVWAQYSGPRLEEGSTTLPENSKLVPMVAECLEDKEVEKCKWVRSLTEKEIMIAKKAINESKKNKNHYGDGSCYYNGVFPCNGCGECDK